MRVAHINVTSGFSTGRIAVDICQGLASHGHRALLCYSRGAPPQGVPSLRVGSRADVLVHALGARLLDRAGFFSRAATRRLLTQLRLFKPDVIHLHNLHGYYLHVPLLLRGLAALGVPVVWTLHDCWAFTGHCAYYSMASCGRWQQGCGHCPQRHAYPASLLVDQSARNWKEKRDAIRALPNLTLVTPSLWLGQEAQRSFLRRYPIRVIPNGIDLATFRPSDEPGLMENVVRRYGLWELGERKMLLSVASTWEPRKGLADLIALSECLREDLQLVVLGLSKRQLADLPPKLLGIPRTQSIRELRALYTVASLCISASHEETQGMTLLEALACGTQVLCYAATALPETVTPDVGEVVPEGDIRALAEACARLCDHPRAPEACHARALAYDRRVCSAQYVGLYEEVLGGKY